MNVFGRIIFICLPLFYLSAQVVKVPVELKTISIKGDVSNSASSLEVYVTELKVDSSAFDTSYSWKEYVLYPEIYTTDGTLVYDGFIASKGTYALQNIRNRSSSFPLFSIPIDKLACNSGEKNLTFHFYCIHEDGFDKQKIAKAEAKKILLSPYQIGFWEVLKVEVPESNSYDVRFLNRAIDGCNSDLYITFSRNSTNVYRSAHHDNTCWLSNLKIRKAMFPKNTWAVNVFDFDNTSFDDKICTFELGDALSLGSTASEFKSSGSVLSIKLTKEPASLVNHYHNQIKLKEIKNAEGVSGIQYCFSGNSITSLMGSEFTSTHFTGSGVPISEFQKLQEASDSVCYFIPFYKYSSDPISIQMAFDYTYGGERAYRYSSLNLVNPPDIILDNSFRNVLVTQEKIAGTMCLLVKAHHSMPSAYRNQIEITSSIGDSSTQCSEFGRIFTAKESESDCEFFIPLTSIESRVKALPISLRSYIMKNGMFRQFASNLDTLKNVTIELEDYALKVLVQMDTAVLNGGRWEFHTACNNKLITAKRAGENFTELSLRKHKDDDLILKFVYADKNQYPYVLTIPSTYLKKKGKKKKLKGAYGMKKLYVVRM